MHSRQIEWEQLLGKWWDFQVSALHFISMLNKRYKFRWYLFQSTAITKMTLGGATWQCQEMKNFTLVAHWGNSYSYSFLRVTPFDFLTTFEIFKGKSQNDQLSRQKVLIFQHCMGLAIDFFALSVMRVGCLTIFVIFCIGRSSKYTSITHARWNRWVALCFSSCASKKTNYVNNKVLVGLTSWGVGNGLFGLWLTCTWVCQKYFEQECLPALCRTFKLY